MSLETWNRQVGDWWANLHGTNEYPYGYYRLPLINPVIWHVATELNAGHEDIGIYAAFAHLEKDRKKNSLEKWCEEKATQSLLQGIKNIDLGCGEGYLGRWLARMGVECVGIDGSDKLIKKSKERNKKNKVTLLKANLDKTEDLKNLSQQLADHIGNTNEKILVTMVALLDHLHNPQALFDELSNILKNKNKTWLLVVTLNHQFYGKTVLPEKQEVTIKHPSKDEYIEVPVLFREKSDYETIFRNSRFHVVDFASPRQPHEYYEVEPKEAPPFNIWLLRPDKRGKFENTNNALNKSRLLSNMQDLRGHLPSQLEFIEFESKEQIIYPHNLGGDIYVVTAGDASLRIHGRGARPFQPGEILGDLETWDHHPSYYSFPVHAGSDGCTVARIPAGTWESILDNSPGANRTGTILFKQLRDRLKTQLWLYQKRDTHGHSFKVAQLPIDVRRLTNLARLFLVAISKEREDVGRVSEQAGSVVYFDLDSAVKLIADTGRGTEFEEELRMLICVGIDGYAGRFLKKRAPAELEAIWKRLVDKISKKLLTKSGINFEEKELTNAPSHNREKIKTAAIYEYIRAQFEKLFTVEMEATGPRKIKVNSTNPKEKLDEVSMRFSKIILDNPLLGEIDKNALKQSVNFLCKVNTHLLFKRKPYFFYISEDSELLLRRLALDENIKSYIENRILFENKILLKQNEPTSFEFLAHEAPSQRIDAYLKTVEGFLHRDLEGMATLRFSVAE